MVSSNEMKTEATLFIILKLRGRTMDRINRIHKKDQLKAFCDSVVVNPENLVNHVDNLVRPSPESPSTAPTRRRALCGWLCNLSAPFDNRPLLFCLPPHL